MQTSKKRKKTEPKVEAELDLHGYTIEIAYGQCESYLRRYGMMGKDTVRVITGKSGRIRYEAPFWFDNWGYKATVSKDGGSFIVRL